jgi:hypothetical protein
VSSDNDKAIKELADKVNYLEQAHEQMQEVLKNLVTSFAEYVAMSDEAKAEKVRANYDKLTEGSIIKVPIECPDGQHWDKAAGKCVEDVL